MKTRIFVTQLLPRARGRVYGPSQLATSSLCMANNNHGQLELRSTLGPFHVCPGRTPVSILTANKSQLVEV